MLPTQRLSPKNQVTLPRDARALIAAGEVDHLRGLTHGLAAAVDGKVYPIVVLMTENELKRREQKVIDDQSLTPQVRETLVTQLNGGAASMAIDGQNRVVLPPHFVSYLGLARDVLFISTNTVIQVWHPDHYLGWSGHSAQPARNPALASYLMI